MLPLALCVCVCVLGCPEHETHIAAAAGSCCPRDTQGGGAHAGAHTGRHRCLRGALAPSRRATILCVALPTHESDPFFAATTDR